MSNKLTSLTGFGEGDPKPEKSDLGTRIMPGHKRRKTSVTHERDSGGVTVFFKRANYNRGASAKAKALSVKMGKSSNYASEGGYSDRAMKRFSANKARKHAEWDKKGI